MTTHTTLHITIQPVDPAEPGPMALIQALDDYLIALYPPESNHLLSVEALRQANVTFLGVIIDGQVAGCGAFVNHSDYVEIKRMYVQPAYRGLKLGRRLLEALETRAQAFGVSLVRLESGIHQPEALQLYERMGYAYRTPFGDYQLDPLSVFMEKELA
ncbi:GNAT family N-acetyltransferase [Chitinivorax sp. B]|uniref:GNAT family N-acetyltransferase n=1 Tax=Chitinivorax sp. B TaxID=2502235 RepID=UPI0020179709|nr:GNAT family N-acetyltransferase [Chitinivorax sp. B]